MNYSHAHRRRPSEEEGHARRASSRCSWGTWRRPSGDYLGKKALAPQTNIDEDTTHVHRIPLEIWAGNRLYGLLNKDGLAPAFIRLVGIFMHRSKTHGVDFPGLAKRADDGVLVWSNPCMRGTVAEVGRLWVIRQRVCRSIATINCLCQRSILSVLCIEG